MSDTTFVHELRKDTPLTRVMLTMDIAEVMSLGLVAGAALDASVMVPDHVDPNTEANAVEILRWSARAVDALHALTPSVDGKE